ncbi:MAG: hypothetical protein Q7T50_07445 [Candidatus Magasanikbacteria bacterium]|nr:hypothetical protein [Candidatus Magasanikbacteria bacterium]
MNEEKSIHLTSQQINMLSARYQVTAKSIKPLELIEFLVAYVRNSEDYLAKKNLDLGFAETLGFLMQEFHQEICAKLRTEMTEQGISKDEINKVINWFSQIVYLAQKK